jgi:hypothetical protein
LVFKEVGTICDSMDALFIGRKKAAGTSARPPLFGNTVFYDQETVDAFVRSCDGEDGQLNTNTLNPNDAKVRIVNFFYLSNIQYVYHCYVKKNYYSAHAPI